MQYLFLCPHNRCCGPREIKGKWVTKDINYSLIDYNYEYLLGVLYISTSFSYNYVYTPFNYNGMFVLYLKCRKYFVTDKWILATTGITV